MPIAEEIVERFKPVHACKKRRALGLAEKGTILTAYEAREKGITGGSTQAYDELLGLDQVAFFTSNQPLSYGENVFVIKPEVFDDEDVLVSCRDVTLSLDYPSTETGKKVAKRGLVKNLKLDNWDEMNSLSIPEQEDLITAILAEGDYYKSDVISGPAYKKLMSVLLAANFDRLTTYAYLDFLSSEEQKETLRESMAKDSLEYDLSVMLEDWSCAEIKMKRPLTVNDLQAVISSDEEILEVFENKGIPVVDESKIPKNEGESLRMKLTRKTIAL